MVDSQQRMHYLIDRLKEEGFRLTPQRIAVLRILTESKDHPSIEDIYEQVRPDFPTMSLATVYKTVSLLKSMGELLELGFADNGSRYDGRRPYSHPHVICTRCGKIADPESPSMKSLADEIAEKSGFRISRHRLDFYGLCPDCQKEI